MMREGCFQARVWRADGKFVFLGTFGTAEAAALTVARDARKRGVEELTAGEAVLRAAAEGLELVRSARSSSGYMGVMLVKTGRFEAKWRRDGKDVYLGTFDAAEAAALAIARDAREHGVEWMEK